MRVPFELASARANYADIANLRFGLTRPHFETRGCGCHSRSLRASGTFSTDLMVLNQNERYRILFDLLLHINGQVQFDSSLIRVNRRFTINAIITINASHLNALIARESIQSIEDNPMSIGIKWNMDP
jgi:hypothetical protein